MSIRALGRLTITPAYGSWRQTGAAAPARSASAGAAENHDLQRFALFLRSLRDLGDEAHRELEANGHSWRQRPIRLAGTRTLALSRAATAATLRSTEAVGLAPTTHTPDQPQWAAADRAGASVAGTYDGSNGSQSLTVRATSGGVVGSDELGFDVLDAEGATLEHLVVAAGYVAGDDIALANGLALRLDAGVVAAGAEFDIDVSWTTGEPTASATAAQESWSAAARPDTSVAGTYDGSNGTQRLTFRVASGGVVGGQEITIDVLDAEGSALQQLTVAAGHEPGAAVALANGLELAIGAGRLGEGDTFAVDVSLDGETSETSFSPVDTAWNLPSRPAAAIGGAYDGSFGSGQVTLRVAQGGTVGAHELLLDVLDEQGEVLQQVTVASGQAVGEPFALAGGITLALGAGVLGAGDTFAVDVAWAEGQAQGSHTADTDGWNPGNSPAATVAGQYDGSQGTQALTLRVAQGGTLGTDEVLLDVLDADGQSLASVSFAPGYEPGQAVALGNGLTLALGAGSVTAGDELQVSVSTSATVDPDAAFDGGGSGTPDWLAGTPIGDGSFTINGAEVAVWAGDTLAGVVARINEAGLGVTATWDPGQGRLVLAQVTAGSGAGIVVADDTSGFVAAMNLDEAVTTAGSDGDFATAIDQVAPLAAVGDGTVTVNGRAISLDAAEDTLAGLVSAFAAAGVELEYDEASGRFSARGRGLVELDDGGTGLLAALGLPSGRIENRGHSFSSPDAVQRKLVDLQRAWNGMFSTALTGTAAEHAARLNAQLKGALTTYFNEAGQSADAGALRTGFGLELRFGADGAMEIALDEDRLSRALRDDAHSVRAFLAGTGDRRGLLDVLADIERPVATGVESVLRVRGISALDTYA